MKATIAWWNLDRSSQTIESLDQYLNQDGAEPWFKLSGLKLKFWVSDVENNLWGAVMLYEDGFYDQPLPPNRATELIGYPPTSRFVFEVGTVVDPTNNLTNQLGELK